MTASYSISLRESAREQLRALPRKDLERVSWRIQSLAADPRPVGCRKLADDRGYRVRQGDYRILYAVDDEAHTLDVYKIGHRREVYR